MQPKLQHYSARQIIFRSLSHYVLNSFAEWNLICQQDNQYDAEIDWIEDFPTRQLYCSCSKVRTWNCNFFHEKIYLSFFLTRRSTSALLIRTFPYPAWVTAFSTWKATNCILRHVASAPNIPVVHVLRAECAWAKLWWLQAIPDTTKLPDRLNLVMISGILRSLLLMWCRNISGFATKWDHEHNREFKHSSSKEETFTVRCFIYK